MSAEILLRLALAAAIIGLGYGAFRLTNWYILSQTKAKTRSLGIALSGDPVLLYFTTPDCVPCKTVQRPAIQKVSELLEGRLQVVEVDASQQPDLASRWGVMSVPTTFLIDITGEARYVNHGVTRAEKLLKQVQSI